MEKNLDLAEELFKAAFAPHRTPRSDAYKRGVMAVLILKCGGRRDVQTYVPGTPELDAWAAGCDEGHLIWLQHIEREAGRDEE
ncbi:MAG: hypothetical protein A2075_23330 [Geobacteraceae bacterium GWC2_58_44]|nr:MAG: hypothetical protein A2075_23330 [Geobacteraceae bacterium GWC2_58_44]